MTPGAEEVLLVPEVASALRVSEQTIRRMIQRGEIRALTLGRAVRIPRTEVDRILADDGAKEATT